MPTTNGSTLNFAASMPGVAYPIGSGAIAVDGSTTYQVSEGCEGDHLPVLRLDSIRDVFEILPKGSFLIVSEAVDG